MNLDFSTLAFLAEWPWLISVIGVVAASAAFLVGRRVLAAQPAIANPQPTNRAIGMAGTLKQSNSERRAFPRRKGNLIEVYLTDDSNNPPLHGWVLDRSVTGLCLVVEKPLAEGAVMSVRPRLASQTAPWTSVEIRSCRADKGEWEVGCQFRNTLQWNDLLLFG